MRTLGLFMIALAIASPMMASAAPLAPEIDAGSAAASDRAAIRRSGGSQARRKRSGRALNSVLDPIQNPPLAPGFRRMPLTRFRGVAAA